MSIRGILARNSLFSELTEDGLDRLIDVGRVEYWTEGAMVLEEGATGPRMMVILEGEVEVPATGGITDLPLDGCLEVVLGVPAVDIHALHPERDLSLVGPAPHGRPVRGGIAIVVPDGLGVGHVLAPLHAAATQTDDRG